MKLGKKHKLIIIMGLSILVFFGGLLTGKIIYKVPTREILVGYDNLENDGQIVFRNKITDVDDQWTIDNLQQILLTSKQIEFDYLTRGKPDVHILINSPKTFGTLTHSEIWFNEEGALIKMSKEDYRTINKGNSDSLKKMIDYKSS
ncbi:hypothetical protein [Bacillus salipaludis]|uniref:Uncharacterized protein n=1 Tax=Bacillus salipaludis TaxID=2547811 RepID=A0ABW8RT26_9BACI